MVDWASNTKLLTQLQLGGWPSWTGWDICVCRFFPSCLCVGYMPFRQQGVFGGFWSRVNMCRWKPEGDFRRRATGSILFVWGGFCCCCVGGWVGACVRITREAAAAVLMTELSPQNRPFQLDEGARSSAKVKRACRAINSTPKANRYLDLKQRHRFSRQTRSLLFVGTGFRYSPVLCCLLLWVFRTAPVLCCLPARVFRTTPFSVVC